MTQPTFTLRIGTSPVVGSEFYWSLNDGSAVRSGFVVIDLAESWDGQADQAVPAGWRRLSPWSVEGDRAVAEVGRIVRAASSKVDTSYPKLRASHRIDTERALSDLFAKMRSDVAARHEDGVKRLISAQWDKELAALLVERNLATASDVAAKVAAAFDSDYDPEVMRAWFEAGADVSSVRINGNAEDSIREAEDNEDVDDPVGHVFGILESSGAAQIATSMVTTAAGFAARDVAEYAGGATKTWQTNSGNPRSSHAALSGETVALSENFSNGMAWPGDPEGGADENAGCMCSLTITR